MNLLCPNCQKPLTVPEQYAGQPMRCPLCSGTFTVPALPTPAAPVAPPSAVAAAGASPRRSGRHLRAERPRRRRRRRSDPPSPASDLAFEEPPSTSRAPSASPADTVGRAAQTFTEAKPTLPVHADAGRLSTEIYDLV